MGLVTLGLGGTDPRRRLDDRVRQAPAGAVHDRDRPPPRRQVRPGSPPMMLGLQPCPRRLHWIHWFGVASAILAIAGATPVRAQQPVIIEMPAFDASIKPGATALMCPVLAIGTREVAVIGQLPKGFGNPFNASYEPETPDSGAVVYIDDSASSDGRIRLVKGKSPTAGGAPDLPQLHKIAAPYSISLQRGSDLDFAPEDTKSGLPHGQLRAIAGRGGPELRLFEYGVRVAGSKPQPIAILTTAGCVRIRFLPFAGN
jgi:hypothetical protein